MHERFGARRREVGARESVRSGEKKSFKVDPLNIANGVNNKIIENVTFEFA